MSGKNKHRSANDHLQYLRRELSNRERFVFEKGLEADPFEQEAMEGLETLEANQAEQDILDLHNSLRKRLSRRRRVAFYSIAATVASLLIVGTVFLKIQNFNPSSDEKQVYPEESFDSGTPFEAQAIPPVQKEAAITEPVSPTPDKTLDRTQADPIPESEPIKIVDQKDKEPNKIETYDFAMPEEDQAETEASIMAVPAPMKEDLKEEQITHLEAEPKARDKEKRVTQSARNSGKRKKSMAQPVAQSPQEISMLSGKVSGIVISAEDQGPIPGAMVENRTFNSYVVTDIDGRFDIAVQEDTNTMIAASFIGMETKEVSVEGGTDVELVLQADPIALEEVMVVKSENAEELAAYTVAEPSVGYEAYKSYIEEHIQFPVENTASEKAVVVLKFKITRKGKIREVAAIRSPGEAFSAEAIRLLKEGPSWIPANNEDGPLDDWIRMRIVFKR
jgi:hypothetical protein